MSESEFSQYLSLLGSLLRLSKGQREEISQELRDYLEDRFEELIEAGYSEQEARTKAIEELGDAAKVASLFQLVSHQSQRRWMMKYASVSIFGCFLLIVMFASMWPDSSRIRPLAPTVAGDISLQEKKVPDTTPKKKVEKSVKRQKTKPNNQLRTSSSRRRSLTINERLNSVFQNQDSFTTNEITEAKLLNYKIADFPKGPITLQDYIDQIRNHYGVNIVISPYVLEDMGLDPEAAEVQCQNGTRLFRSIQNVLQALPTDGPLDFTILDGTICVNAEDSKQLNTTQVLNLEKLFSETEIQKKEIQEVYHDIVIDEDRIADEEFPVKWVGNQLVLRHSGSTQIKFKTLLRRLYPDFEKEKRQQLLEKLQNEYLSKTHKEKRMR